MPKIRHPLSGAVYDQAGDDTIVVESNGRAGRFRSDGSWIDGEVRTADPELCRWISDPRLPSRHRVAIEGAATDQPTGAFA